MALANEVANKIERCPICNGVMALIGKAHNCVPRPRFGDVVNVPLSEMPARGIGPKRARDPLSAQGAGPAPGRAVLAEPPKPATAQVSRASKAVTSTTYDHRDPEQRREYQRDLMRKRRAKT